MKRKVAFIIPSLRGGGAERVIINIIRNLDYKQFDISLILLKKEGPYINLLPENIKVVDLDTLRVRKSIIPLIKAINAIKPDAILSTMGHLNLAILAIRFLLKGNPKIIIREANTPSKNITKKERFFSFLYKHLYPKSDLIIAQCKDMKNDIIDFFKVEEKKIQYIYNPLDIEKIRDSREGGNPYQEKMVNLLSVGRLSQQKGFDVLINAFKIVKEKIPNAHLTILGEGSLKDELQDLAEKIGVLDEISFVGFKNNPYPYYYYADTYILSSRWEGFPNSLLEALACETKVVATDCKSGPREIIGDNEYGILVKEGDYIALAEGIIKSINGINKSKNRAANFTIEKIIKEYENVLK
ncbi:glycosyltransferase involved in cell wall biosynthesis [Peribacillus simplex]